MKPPSACRGCGQSCSGSVCAKCKPKFQEHVRAKEKYRNDDTANAPYHGMPWINFSREIRRQNVLCQRVEHGVQCRYKAQLTHHLLSPRQHPALLLSPKNVVALCRSHHPDTEGDPGNLLYVPTRWLEEAFSHVDIHGRPMLPDATATGIDSWLRALQSGAKALQSIA